MPKENMGVCLEPQSGFDRIYSKIQPKKWLFWLIFVINSLNTIRASQTTVGQGLGAPPASQKKVPREKNKIAFLKKLNFSPQAPKPKAIAHRFWAFFMGLYGAALEFWNDILKVPSRRRRDEKGGSPFGDPEWFWQNLFKNLTKKN